MLCKRTMRVALAPVIGLIGVLLAGTALAEFDMTPPTGGKTGDAIKIASETLSNSYTAEIKGVVKVYRLGATGTELRIRAATDILLPNNTYYVRYDFSGARFTEAVDIGRLQLVEAGAETKPALGDVTSSQNGVQDIVYGGAQFEDSVVFRLSAAEHAKGTQFFLNLSGAVDGAVSTGDAAADAMELDTGLGVSGRTDVSVSMSVHDSVGDARDKAGALFTAGPIKIISVESAVSGDVSALVDTADVATPVLDGGPFRRFVSGGMGGASSGVLATASVTVDTSYRDAMFARPVTAGIVTGVMATATSDEQEAFAVIAAADGGLIKDNRMPWMVSSSTACGDGGLKLGLQDGMIDTYDDDPDGDGFKKAGFLTAAGIASANQASGLVAASTLVGAKGDDKAPTGYFCVLAKDNKNMIPSVGNSDTKDAYMLTLAPQTGSNFPVKPDATAPMAAGAIKRNGTTVHLTYLTTNPFVDQRLVVVNRGTDEAMFWIDEGGFNVEEGTEVTMNSLEDGHVVPGHGRAVVKITDVLDIDGNERRAISATVNVLAPPRDIDVMTIQRSPFTDEVDTTRYQAQDR